MSPLPCLTPAPSQTAVNVEPTQHPWFAAIQAFLAQVKSQLPAFENEDYGLILYGLASMAQPLDEQFLSGFIKEATRKLYGLSGEGLGYLVWGMAQYGYSPADADAW